MVSWVMSAKDLEEASHSRPYHSLGSVDRRLDPGMKPLRGVSGPSAMTTVPPGLTVATGRRARLEGAALVDGSGEGRQTGGLLEPQHWPKKVQAG